MQPQDQNQPNVNDTPQDNQPTEMSVSDLAAAVSAEADQIKDEKSQDTYSQTAKAEPAYDSFASVSSEPPQNVTELNNPTQNPEPIVGAATYNPQQPVSEVPILSLIHI